MAMATSYASDESSPLLPPTYKEGHAGTYGRATRRSNPAAVLEEEAPWASRFARYKYYLTLVTVSFQLTSPATLSRSLPRQTVFSSMVGTLLVMAFVLTTYTRLYAAGMTPGVRRQIAPPSEIQSLWGAYTPYLPVERYRPPPHRCKINQVNIIQRHGARFPTSGSAERILSALKKLQDAPVFTDFRLSFIKGYQYPLGEAELVPFGAYQSAESGAVVYDRYRKLVSKGNIPFVRASGSSRVIDSATNWTAGFAEASNNVYEPRLSVVLNENLNDTLEDAMCPRSGDSEEQTASWTDIFARPIADRINTWAPGANLVPEDVPALMSLCAFESVALEKISSWCSLFTPKEFAQYEYYSDLEKYYRRGYGQELGPVQGVGYINELLARLTGQPVRDNTQTNRTLTGSPVTFPLDRKIYADFSHDNLMVAVYSAMGLFKQRRDLDPTRPDRQRTWISSKLVPFSARLVVERMECRGLPPRGIRHATLEDTERSMTRKNTFVRVLVNDAVQPLPFCDADAHGLCELDAFVKSQAYARHDGEGDFEKCFEGL